jgi:hypothetical protein
MNEVQPVPVIVSSCEVAARFDAPAIVFSHGLHEERGIDEASLARRDMVAMTHALHKIVPRS